MNLTEIDLRWALFCVSSTLDRRRVRYEPIPAALVESHRRLTAAYSAMSADGPQISLLGTELDEPIGTDDAAEILNVTPRHIRRIAADLDGIKVGTDWTFKRSTVERYAQGRQHS